MNAYNILFSIYSLTALVIIIERLFPSPLLPPFNFIRLHEINQTVIFITITVAISFFYLRILTQQFKTLTKKRDFLLALCFVIGIYLYGAGEGWHEVASFTLNTYCDVHALSGNLCNGLFINDYYAGNIIFFIGGLLVTVPLLLLASYYPEKAFSKKEMAILIANSLVFAFTWFAYAAFDKVLVGLFFSAVLLFISGFFFLRIHGKYSRYPFITYSFIAYLTATVAALIVRYV